MADSFYSPIPFTRQQQDGLDKLGKIFGFTFSTVTSMEMLNMENQDHNGIAMTIRMMRPTNKHDFGIHTRKGKK